MAQAGIHGMVGIAMKKLSVRKEWLFLGIILGNLIPDLDSLLVGIATLSGGDTHGLHRTWSHSIPFMIGLVVVFYGISALRKSPRIGNLGLGLGTGMLIHALLDLVIWFRGVQLFWPFYPEINFWASYTPPDWWYNKFESAIEFGFIAIFLIVLGRLAMKNQTDIEFLPQLKMWTWIEIILFVIFLVLVYTWSGYFIAFGTAYIVSLLVAIFVTIRMKNTISSLAM